MGAHRKCPKKGGRSSSHPGGNPGANLKSISHRCPLILVAFVWELTKEIIILTLGCLQGGAPQCSTPALRPRLTLIHTFIHTNSATMNPPSPISGIKASSIRPLHPHLDAFTGITSLERLVIYCQTTSVSAAHATHCATYCTPCRPLIRAFSGWIRTPPPTLFSANARFAGSLQNTCRI